MMKFLNLILIILLFVLQLKLWAGGGGVDQLFSTRHKIKEQLAENQKAADRNKAISAEVISLQNGYEAIEAHARSELGLIKSNEKFFILVNPRQ